MVGSDGPIKLYLTDEQAERLENHIQTGSSDELTRVDPVKDIYDSVRSAISSHEMSGCDLNYLREFGEEDEDVKIDLDEAVDSYLDTINLTV